MTSTPALVHFLVAASKSSSSSSLLTLLPLLAIGVLGYFFFIRPQQRKAQAARQSQGSGIEVGDEVQTVGGVIGTVLEIHGDRYTLLTGALGDDGNLDGPQPTRIVFVRQAIARKIDRIDDIRDVQDVHDVQVEDEPDEDETPSTNGMAKGSTNSTGTGTSSKGDDGDIDDVGGNATSGGERSGESEEA
jgi:preprotein translocase YajC subunit